MAYFIPKGFVKVNGEWERNFVKGNQMEKFLLSVEKDEYGFYRAVFSDGTMIDLETDNYADAVCAADQMENV